MVEVRRTAVVKLDIGDSDATLLHETIEEYLWACNYVVQDAWKDDYKPTSKTELHDRTYSDVREQTRLQANLVQSARNKAAEAIKGVVARWQNGKMASQPNFTTPSVRYDKRSATFHDDRVSLSTVDGRVEAGYVLPPEGDNPQTEYLRNDDYEVTGATLQYRDETDTFYLHIGTKAEVESEIPNDGDAGNSTVLGVDLGIEQIAVTSTGQFWSGGYLNHRRQEYERVRGDLQQTGTESAHRTIKQMGDRETRWVEDYLHRISKAIVQEAVAHGCDIIAFEELTDIRDRMPNAKKFHAWAFRQLYDYVAYKAEVEGIETTQVDPAYTSQRCSRCGTTLRENRPSQAKFCCQKCGYEVNPDYNAAKNIGMKMLRAGQKSPHGGATRHLALKSGTLNVNGEYSPADQ
ncbi:IS200/IS605 family element transposase accessory protein TnpB (plasmid) [Halolamina sp. CBA1230]|uniref:RNA-guided endonuclease InsQ/TnpB family protein n=1 Tax=Halolamina sp. CBA1230 TaxID=1853690 RepID=UPI00117B6684|nr:RNA-guided endonuclease TnpB family protein [Halolamina sp. CBA1230]QKY21833.1 IS200/IS605 family element transposase accessory protein TnpB [Halolamina sp. CBA1230]